MAHPGGAPRTVSPPPEECVKLGQELVTWFTEPTTEWRCLFQQWYSLEKKILRKDWKTLIQREEFMPYYEQAQAALAVRCVNGTMKDGFGQRYLRLYDYTLVEEENAQAKFDASLKKPENNAPTKVTFEVNYGTGNQIEILPKALPASDSPST